MSKNKFSNDSKCKLLAAGVFSAVYLTAIFSIEAANDSQMARVERNVERYEEKIRELTIKLERQSIAAEEFSRKVDVIEDYVSDVIESTEPKSVPNTSLGL